MSHEQQVAELERRHQALKRAINEASLHPGSDDTEITSMKRMKLQLKDEIARLKSRRLH